MDGLTKSERAEFDRCKQVVKAGLASWVSVSLAMIEIRDRRLYREEYDTFEACCTEEFGISKVHAYRLIEAAGVAQELEIARKSFIDNKNSNPRVTNPTQINTLIEPPESERQLRELAKAPAGQRAAVLAEAQKKTGKAQPTAKEIQKVVATRAAKPAAESEPEPAEPWAGFIGELATIQSELRGIAHRLYKLMDIDADGKHPRCKWAGGYSYDGTVGAVNSLIRALERNAPTEAAKNPRGYLVKWEVDQRDAMKKGAGR